MCLRLTSHYILPSYEVSKKQPDFALTTENKSIVTMLINKVLK